MDRPFYAGEIVEWQGPGTHAILLVKNAKRCPFPSVSAYFLTLNEIFPKGRCNIVLDQCRHFYDSETED